MDFLSRLYSNENFGIILFIIISILVLAFLIVLFFGKKDQKERQLAETKNLDINSESGQNAFQDVEEPSTLEVPVPPMETPIPPTPIIEPKEPAPMEFNEVPVTPEPVKEEMTPISIEDTTVIPKTDFDFDALAESISKELEGLNKEPTEESKNDYRIPDIPVEIPKMETPVIKEEPKTLEMKESYRASNPAPFSSVFVNRKPEEKKEEMPIPITPKKSTIELPKTIDLPKLNKEEVKETPVIQNSTSNIVFPGLENNVSAYPKNDENRM